MTIIVIILALVLVIVSIKYWCALEKLHNTNSGKLRIQVVNYGVGNYTASGMNTYHHKTLQTFTGTGLDNTLVGIARKLYPTKSSKDMSCAQLLEWVKLNTEVIYTPYVKEPF